MGASQLSLYNKALRWLEERQLASLTEPREPRRLLDAEWEDAVNTCLYMAYWKFAIRQVMATPDSAAVPNFGRKYSFRKPDDWVKTYQISTDDRFFMLYRDFVDENNIWYGDPPTLYIRYVSRDPNFGWNLGYWTPGFVEYLAGYLALLIAPRIKQSEEKVTAIEKRLARTKAAAMASDAMDGPPGRIPIGTWAASRAPRGSIYPGMGDGGWDGY